MSAVGTQNLPDLTGQTAVDHSGEEVGTIVGVYLDNDTRQPEWAAVDLDGSELTLVPLAGATPTAGGVQLAFGWEDIEDSPYRESQLPRAVAEEDKAELSRHYGLGPAPRRRRRRPLRAPESSGWSEVGPRDAAATAADQGKQAAATAADQGKQVASTAADQSRQVASAATQQSQEVAQAAASEARDVADTAKQELSYVGEELSEQARSMLDETKGQLQDQAETQVERLAETLRSFGTQAEALADGRPSEAGPLPDYVRNAAGRLEQLADDLDDRGVEGLVEDLQSFARRRPGVFLLGAAAVGFGVGRLLRAQSDDDSSGGAPSLPRGGR